MARDFNLSDIPTDRRVFIRTAEWNAGETRSFWFTGKEKVNRTSKSTGKPYVSYFIYLIPINGSEVEFEQTLEIFASQAASLKEASPQPYQKLSVTKRDGERGAEWEFSRGTELMPEKQRPSVADYPEYSPVPAPTKPSSEEEINIDEIPF